MSLPFDSCQCCNIIKIILIFFIAMKYVEFIIDRWISSNLVSIFSVVQMKKEVTS